MTLSLNLTIHNDAISAVFEGLDTRITENYLEWNGPSGYKEHLLDCKIELATNEAQVCNTIIARKPIHYTE